MVQPIGKNIRGIISVVERQLRNWEINREQSQKRKAEEEPFLKFFLTISREAGCGGEEIADQIAIRTGFQKYDKELLDHMVKQGDLRRQLYETLDDKTVGWIESVISAISFGPTVDSEEYFHRLCHAVLAICHNSHAIILGRGANSILPRKCGLSIRLVAPKEFRVKHYAARCGIDMKAAQKELYTIEKQRGQFIENYFGRFAYDPRRFDIVINISQFELDRLVDMIVKAIKVKAGPDFVLPIDRKR
jgi:cytidylate kinase